MSAYHLFLPLKSFLLSLAVRSVSRTGSVANGHMVCLAGRIKHSPPLFPKPKARMGLKSKGYPRWNAGPPRAHPAASVSKVENS